MITNKMLYDIAHQSETAVAMFEAWSQRLRDKSHVDVAQFRRGVLSDLGHHKFSRRDFEKVFKDLESAGAGKMVLSPKGYPKYFEVKVSIKDVGRAGTQRLYSGQVKPFKSYVVPTKRMSQRLRERVEVSSVPKVETIMIPMSPTRLVKIELPSDITAGEVGLVTVALSSLKNNKDDVADESAPSSKRPGVA